MGRIRFLSDQIYETLGHKKGPMFPKGFVLDESDVGEVLGVRQDAQHATSFLDRWLVRGAAERVTTKVTTSPLSDVTVVGVPAKPIVSGEQEQRPEDIEPAPVDYAKLTRVELDALAADRGVDISTALVKDDVIAALQLADEKTT